MNLDLSGQVSSCSWWSGSGFLSAQRQLNSIDLVHHYSQFNNRSMTLLIILMWMNPPNLNFQCWAMRICESLFYVHWLCDQDDTCGVYFLCCLALLFILIASSERGVGGGNQSNLYNRIYLWQFYSGKSNKNRGPFKRRFCSGELALRPAPSSPDGAAAQRDGSDRWNDLQAAEETFASNHSSTITRTRCIPGLLYLAQKSFESLGPNSGVKMEISLLLQTEPHSRLAGSEGMMSCVWLPPKRVREARLGSLRCHSPVQCCLNMIRQGSTVKRLKA